MFFLIESLKHRGRFHYHYLLHFLVRLSDFLTFFRFGADVLGFNQSFTL